MRITFLAPYADLGGGIRVLAIHADRLRRRGHEVLVISQPLRPPPLRKQVRSFLRGKGWFRQPPPEESHLDHVDVPHRRMPRWKPITDEDVPDADVVVATWWETAEWVARLSPRKGAKAYLVQGHEVFDYLPRERSAATYRLPLHKIVVSSWLARIMRDLYGDDDVSLVPNAVDHRQFFAAPRDRQPVPTAGFIYSGIPIKGCATTFDALARVRRELPALRLVSFGHDEPTRDLPLPAGTEYLRSPPQERIREIYSRCDVWVSGSTSEGFSLPIAEAMACRCPVVSTEVGAALDLVTEGVTGHVVPVGDAAAMADRVLRILRLPPAPWRAMSDAAADAARRHDWDAATTLLERALEKAILESGRGAT